MTPQIGDFAILPIQGGVGVVISVGEWLDGSALGDRDHAVIYVGHDMTMGAYPGGAGLRPLPADQSKWLWSTGHIALTAAQRSQILRSAMSCEGIGYSALDYFALAAHRLHVPVPGLKDFIQDTGHMICSQLVDFCYSTAGVHLFADGRWPGYVTPADLAAVIAPGKLSG